MRTQAEIYKAQDWDFLSVKASLNKWEGLWKQKVSQAKAQSSLLTLTAGAKCKKLEIQSSSKRENI